MNWNIKRFNELTLEQLYQIMKIRSEIFVVEQNCVYLDIDGNDTEVVHIFLEDKNEVLAYARILPKGIYHKQASIGRVLVNEKYRKNGYATELMNKSIDYIKSQMYEKEIKISAQNYLFKFYSTIGFKKVSDVYLEDGIEHIDMIMNIN